MKSLSTCIRWLVATWCIFLIPSGTALASNSTFYNPAIPGFHPDPSCTFVPEWDNTFFCASSSFNAFPGIPLHASKDLQNWKLIGHALNREYQLPRLVETNRSTSGIWAPTLRFHDETFWLVTTLVDDDRSADDASRWDNIIFKSINPYEDSSWSNATHFEFVGYDTEPFWDKDGKTYINGAHAWKIGPWLQQAEANLDTGEVGEWRTIWNGTGGMAPEGPHIYLKDGLYYLLAAEGGTGVGHMVTIARSENAGGPYESNPANPILTNANTTSYFQTVGHADLFQDDSGNWWGVALSTRSGPEWVYFPMGRETVLTAVTWRDGEWPQMSPIQGKMSDEITAPVPEEWVASPVRLEVKAANLTHYSFSAGPANAASRMKTLVYASNDALSWGFTGVFVGVYCTSNGGLGSTPAYISDWTYIPQGQYRD
ncbi:hypothetical protein CGMCC3_g10227 [Colletotrichum fructicola]|nr:uncharacterized protein CGMCC3_g10227 [Colletotrichum fructicola]KAE9573860.1 hypothetical protein CGMCC3_g10227 [Colletotrichum fructicola]